MVKNRQLYRMTAAALLIAIGILIPLVSPAKIVLEPASFTLASHVPIFLSMFISPFTAAAVSLGTTIGFFMGGFPIVVVLRAGTQIVFAVLGAWAIQKWPIIISTTFKTTIFSLIIGLIHALGETIVSSIFYFNGSAGAAAYNKGFVVSILLLVGVGTIVHSMVDYAISLFVLKAVSKQPQANALFELSPFKKSMPKA